LDFRLARFGRILWLSIKCRLSKKTHGLRRNDL
jgi:hypothetical protein